MRGKSLSGYAVWRHLAALPWLRPHIIMRVWDKDTGTGEIRCDINGRCKVLISAFSTEHFVTAHMIVTPLPPSPSPSPSPVVVRHYRATFGDAADVFDADIHMELQMFL